MCSCLWCACVCACVFSDFCMCWIEKIYKWPHKGRFTHSLPSFNFRYWKLLMCRLISAQFWAKGKDKKYKLHLCPWGKLAVALLFFLIIGLARAWAVHCLPSCSRISWPHCAFSWLCLLYSVLQLYLLEQGSA